MQLIQLERNTKLGRVGDLLAAERLREHRFTDVEDMNQRRANYPFADQLAARDGTRYLIGVKTRNEMRQGEVGLNASYNLVLIPDATNAELKRQGKTVEQITSMMLAEVADLASRHEATPAWITVAVNAKKGTYSAYFGLVSDLGNKRSVPMTPRAPATYLCLAEQVADPRITADLLNS